MADEQQQSEEQKPQEEENASGEKDQSQESGQENSSQEEAGQASEEWKGKEKKYIGQITDLRKKNQELQVKLQGESSPKEGETPADETEAKVHSILQKERLEESRENRVEALRKFQGEHPEYSPENDLSGIRMEMLMETLKRFNTESSRGTEQILRDFTDAHSLMSKDKDTTEKGDLGSAASSSPIASIPQKADNRLSSKEEELRKEKGWTMEKFLKVKERHPDILQNL